MGIMDFIIIGLVNTTSLIASLLIIMYLSKRHTENKAKEASKTMGDLKDLLDELKEISDREYTGNDDRFH